MRSVRHEFSARTKKAANLRAGGRCEARGAIYGLEPGARCTAILGAGNREHDHWPLAADIEGSDTLENCVTCCRRCHAYKTANYDIPMRAKSKRVRRRAGLDPDTRKHKPRPIRSAPFRHGPKQRIPSRPFPKR